MSLQLSDCTKQGFIWTIITIIIAIILNISIIIFGYDFCKNRYIRKKTAQKTETPLFFFIGLFYIFLTILTITSNILLIIDNCNTLSDVESFWKTLFIATYSIQAYTLCIIWFIRLKNVFNGGSFQLKKCTVYFFYICFIIGGITAIPALFDQWKNISFLLYLLISSIATIAWLFVFISLTVVFINKLLVTFRNIKSTTIKDDAFFVKILIKVSLLTFMSLIITLIVPVSILLKQRIVSYFTKYIANFICLIDIYTNLLCVMLSYRLNEKYYNILCGCLHKCLRNKCCGQSLNEEQNLSVKIQMDKDMKNGQSDETAEISVDSGGVATPTSAASQ